MPRVSQKAELIDETILDAFIDMECCDTDEEELKEEILDTAVDKVLFLLQHRYSCPRKRVIRSHNWWDNIVPSYDDDQFRHEFRVTRMDFDKILNIIRKYRKIFTRKQHKVEFQLAVALSRFGEYGLGTSLAQKSSKCSLGVGTIFQTVQRVVKALLRAKRKHIVWPNAELREEICKTMQDKLPLCIGCIDVNEIKLRETPLEDHESYRASKKTFTIKIQTVVDNNGKFLDVEIGSPGSVHDSTVYANSSLAKNYNELFTNGQYVIGDFAYPLKQHLITPFRKFSRASREEQKLFNRVLATHRSSSHKALGTLKEIFGSLKELPIRVKKPNGHKLACDWIAACCVLYNIITPNIEEYRIDTTTTDLCDTELNEPFDQAAVNKRHELFTWVKKHYN